MMKFKNLKYTPVNKINIKFNKISKAIKELQNYGKLYESEIRVNSFTSLIPNGI
jgi:hypothetical protein